MDKYFNKNLNINFAKIFKNLWTRRDFVVGIITNENSFGACGSSDKWFAAS
jgi:hypothetical protein